MRVGWHLAQRVLLRTAAREPGEPGLDAAVGRVASELSGLWQPAAEGAFAAGRPGGQSQTGGAAAGVDGGQSGLSQAQPEPAWARTSDLPLPLGRAGNQRSGPGLVQRHHVCADGLRVHVSGGGHGLVESLCAGLGAVQQPGQRVLYSGLDGALARGRQPLISNTDQGCQFTSEAYLEAVESAGVDVSMDGRGRWIDNRFIERLWRSVKQEDIYVQDYGDGLTAQRGLARWFGDYNTVRPHQALGYSTPGELYHSPESYGAKPAAWRWK